MRAREVLPSDSERTGVGAARAHWVVRVRAVAKRIVSALRCSGGVRECVRRGSSVRGENPTTLPSILEKPVADPLVAILVGVPVSKLDRDLSGSVLFGSQETPTSCGCGQPARRSDLPSTSLLHLPPGACQASAVGARRTRKSVDQSRSGRRRKASTGSEQYTAKRAAASRAIRPGITLPLRFKLSADTSRCT